MTITGGIWGARQALNATESLRSNIDSLENDGALDNLRLAAGETGFNYREPVFMDAAVHKTLDAVVWEWSRTGDPELVAWIDKVVDILERAQLEDGYLNSFVQYLHPEARYANLRHSHEIYCGAILMSAAVAAERTGLPSAGRLMGVARKFADHVVAEFLDARPEIDGHEGAEFSFIEFYRHTGEQKYLDLASQFLLGRGTGRVDPNGRRRYFQDHETVFDATTEVGHAVRAMYLETGVLDLYFERGDERLLAASIVRWEDMLATKTYLTGGLGSRHAEEAFGDAWELPSDRAYAETCASYAAILWNWRLLMATGQARFAEFIERSLYNVIAASTSLDGRHFFYVNPLQRRADHFESDDAGRRHTWFECPCCPPNITRLLSSLSGYVVTTTPDTLFLHQLIPATVDVDVDGRFAVRVETEYPWSGAVSIAIDQAPSGLRTIAIRQPSWAPTGIVTVDGGPIEASIDDSGYLSVTAEWQAGQNLVVDFELTTRVLVADERIDALRGTVAFQRGPLVYCFEDVDQPDGVDVADLRIPSGGAVRVRHEPSFPIIGSTVILEVDAEHVTPEEREGSPYFDIATRTVSRGTPVVATAVPYFLWDNRDGRGMRVWLPSIQDS
ncbi:glycoside hydrolase family 127 protein [Glaciibacter superstes]|uniref:glycoside hydrolase family 127 protein n=1 Tax=Glaciibacter superstes TaxID=501023 RepID=UPI0004085AF7|nr:beta-L-arabinofuranosidase domain-containing protein [Glaciibacter superstes]